MSSSAPHSDHNLRSSLNARDQFSDVYSTAGNIIVGGMRLDRWLRHCATSRKVTGSIPDGLNGIDLELNRHGPAVNSASNRNQCQEYFLGDEGG